jgi:hypothetical protein
VQTPFNYLAGHDRNGRHHRALKIKHVVLAARQLGEDCQYLVSIAYGAAPDPGVCCAARQPNAAHMKLVPDQMFIVEMHDERTDIATDIQHHWAAGRRVLPRRAMRMSVCVNVRVRVHDGGCTSKPLTGTPRYGKRLRKPTGGVVPSVTRDAAPSGVKVGSTSG